MDTDLSRVIVTPGATAQTTQVHHRDFPEIRADGKSAERGRVAPGQQAARSPWTRR